MPNEIQLKMKCANGHEQIITYAEGFNEDMVHDHGVLMCGGVLRSIGREMPGYPCQWRGECQTSETPPCGSKVSFSVEKVAPPPVDRSNMTTLHGTPIPELREKQAAQRVGMHADYIVLSDEERAKGFVRPVRTSYIHIGKRPKYPTRELTNEEKELHNTDNAEPFMLFEEYPPEAGRLSMGRFWTEKELKSGCGSVTTMGIKLAETYARDPHFYSATFCCRCNAHFPVGESGEFEWAQGQPGVKVGT